MRQNVLEAVKFVCGEIEESDKDSLYVTPDARHPGAEQARPVHRHLHGRDAAARGQGPDARRSRATSGWPRPWTRCLAKIQKNQRHDGTWGGEGWATTIQQGMAVKGLNRAAQYGARSTRRSAPGRKIRPGKSFDKSSGKFEEEGSAGVQLYTRRIESRLGGRIGEDQQAAERQARTASWPVPRPRPPRRPRPVRRSTATRRRRRTWPTPRRR